MKKASHQANVVRILEILPHNNADTLELIHIGGYQCVVKKGSFKAGDLAVYIQPDSVVPQTEPFRFIWEGHQTDPVGEVPVRKRRITVRKFRGEWSEGLLLPTSDFPALFHDDFDAFYQPVKVRMFKEGDDLSDRLGITHWSLYGEVTPTQKGFNYGCGDGEVKFFIFDIRTPDGQWLPYFDARMSGAGLSFVPLLYTGPFDIEKIKPLVDGQSQVPGVKHIREGAVVKPIVERNVRGLGRLILKIVSNTFLEKDSK